MPIEELIRFRSDLKSNPHLRAQASSIVPEPHGVISLVAVTGSVVEFANQLGYNFSEAEVQRLLDKLALVEVGFVALPPHLGRSGGRSHILCSTELPRFVSMRRGKPI